MAFAASFDCMTALPAANPRYESMQLGGCRTGIAIAWLYGLGLFDLVCALHSRCLCMYGSIRLPPFAPFSCRYACVSVLIISYLQPDPSKCPCVAHCAFITGVVGGNEKAKASCRRALLVMLVILAKQRTSVRLLGLKEGSREALDRCLRSRLYIVLNCQSATHGLGPCADISKAGVNGRLF